MTTAIATARQTAPSTEVADPFAAQGSEGASGSVKYVKFTGATGLFTYGQDDDVLEHGTKLAIDMFNAEWIWTFWWDGEVMEQFSDSLIENPLSYDNPPMELPEDPEGVIDMTIEEIMQARKDDPANFRDGWSVQASFNGRTIDGEDEQFCLKLNQGVAMNSFHALRKSFGRQYKLKDGLIPIIEVTATSYEPKAKNAGKKRWAPSLKITEWASEAELMAMAGEDPSHYDDEPDPVADKAEADAPDAKPARGRRGASKPAEDKAPADAPETEAEAPAEDAPAEDKPAPTGRRGRRGARGANMG